MSPKTFVDMLRDRAESAQAAQPAIHFRRDRAWHAWTWSEYFTKAQSCAASLWEKGVRPGAHVMMLIPEIEPAVSCLFGLWTLGAVPIQVGLPYRLNDLPAYLTELQKSAARLDVAVVIVSDALAGFASPQQATGLRILSVSEILATAATIPDPSAYIEARSSSAPAFIQLTSGSTDRSRAVVIPWERLILHMESMSRCLPSHAQSVAVSWLPLHHDMGLVGGLLFPFYNSFPLYMMSPADFRTSPLSWLETMSQAHGTICAAPPSAYAMCLRLAARAAQAGLSLAAWECAMIGAEPISASLLRSFALAFAPVGFRAEAFFPVYGLAEATVAVTFPKLLAPTRIEHLDRHALMSDLTAVPRPDHEDGIDCIGLGRPILHTEIRLIDERGESVPERKIGEVLVRSATLMAGYYHDSAATAAAIADGWLKTGDLGYIAGGDFFFTGRKKELIIKGGRNLIPSVIEEAASSIDGVRPGGVAAVGVWSEKLQTERLFLVVETKLSAADHPALAERLMNTLKTHGLEVDQVVFLEAGGLPKTTSGKIKRRALAQQLQTSAAIETAAASS